MNLLKLIKTPGRKIVFSKTMNSHVIIDEDMSVLFSGTMSDCLLELK